MLPQFFHHHQIMIALLFSVNSVPHLNPQVDQQCFYNRPLHSAGQQSVHLMMYSPDTKQLLQSICLPCFDVLGWPSFYRFWSFHTATDKCTRSH